MTGYELSRAIVAELDPVWRAEFSQIYPTLVRLRRAGFASMRVAGPKRGPGRNVYRITSDGRRELARWLVEPPRPPRARDESLARLAFLDALPARERAAARVRFEQTLVDEIHRLRRAPRPRGTRGDVRDAILARLESLRRWTRSSIDRDGTAQESPISPAAAAKKK
jgi:DNA-binding PadR family transcriptional regulator